MRIAVGQLWQETNTFNRNATTIDDFDNWGVCIGPQVIEEYGETGELGGFLEACREWDSAIEFIGLARYACWPWGPVSADAWMEIRETFESQLSALGSVDAVFLVLHGAMTAENEPDLTGALLERVQAHVGPKVTVVGTLDLHANITPRMLKGADLLIGYHACPHIDSWETGGRAAKGLRTILEAVSSPRTIWRKLPMITAAENHNTFEGPPARLYGRLQELEASEDVLSAGLYMAMPWCDVPHLGWSVVLSTCNPSEAAEAVVDDLADTCWDLRETMEAVERFSPRAVVEKALSIDGHPVVIGDGADATNSGAPGDSTHLLAEFLRRPEIPHGALTFLVDPEAVALAFQTGVGSSLNAMIGGGFAPEYSSPARFHGVVERLLNVEFVLSGHISKNLPIRMGRGAVVRSGDVCVLLTERSGPGSSPDLYRTAGLEPTEFGIVVAKSPAGFRADYRSFAAAMLLADCPGCAAPDWSRLQFLKAHRPLWPLDKIRDPSEAGWCRFRSTRSRS